MDLYFFVSLINLDMVSNFLDPNNIAILTCCSSDDEPFDTEKQLTTELAIIDNYLTNNSIVAEMHILKINSW